MSDFKQFNLLSPIYGALARKGYVQPTPIQSNAIPPLLQGSDLLGIAQTGTGKTAAFALPILDRLARHKIQTKSCHARALILTPTRELASQIDASVQAYGVGLNLSTAVIFGGVGYYAQIRKMKKGVDVLVATPGRLLDMIKQGYVEFSQLEVFVLDEADRMLDMGFVNDVRKVIKKLPAKRQTLFFSATMSNEISMLANSILKNPVRVEVTPQATTVKTVDQRLYMVERTNKTALLKDILQKEALTRVLVFTRTKHGADRVAQRIMKSAISADCIHGNKSQSARERALGLFRSGGIKVLVATDIAARGIDVPDISHVINFDFPNEPESYIHRIGRTARAGRTGVAISFCDDSEYAYLRAVERLIKSKVPVDTTHAYHYDVSAKSTPQASYGGHKRRRPRHFYRHGRRPSPNTRMATAS